MLKEHPGRTLEVSVHVALAVQDDAVGPQWSGWEENDQGEERRDRD